MVTFFFPDGRSREVCFVRRKLPADITGRHNIPDGQPEQSPKRRLGGNTDEEDSYE
jgi:hypothetical protein